MPFNPSDRFAQDTDFSASYNPTDRLLPRIVEPGLFPRTVLPLAGRAAAVSALGELLGRRRRRSKAKKHHPRRRWAVKKFKALSPVEQKKKLAAAIKKVSPAVKKRLLRLAALRALKIKANAAKLKKALAKNPKLKKVVIKRLIRHRLQNLAKNQADWRGPRLATSDAQSAVPQLETPSAPPVAAPVQPAVEEDHATPTDQETTESDMEEQALDTSEAQDEANAEAQQEVEETTEETTEETEEASNDEELSEPTDEEAAEEAEADAEEEAQEETDDNANEDGTEGESLLGAMKKAARKKSRHKRVLHAARPTAHAIHKKSGGKIPAHDTMRGCALIQAAKAGNPKAKAAIKVLEEGAAKGNAKAKKALAHLKLCNGVLKKARKSVAKRVAAPRKAGKKRTVYNTPVRLQTKGLQSYSAHQRGLAMIPATARAMFRGVSGQGY
jgi:hypothetical protein